MRQFLIILSLLLCLTTIGTIGMHELTDRDWLHSLYLAVVTLTTVGSRDVPDEPAIMMFVVVYLVCGLGVFTYSAFSLGQIIVNADFRRVLEKRAMQRRMKELDGHFIVCGLGRMGMAICEWLDRKEQPFVAIDIEEDILSERAKQRNWLYLQGDAADDDILTQAGIARARGLSAALPSDADNLYVVLSARLLAPKLQIVARAHEPAAVQKLKRAGATRVISPFHSGAEKMARTMISPHLEDFLEISDGGRNLEIVELEIDSRSRYIGRELGDTDFTSRGIIIIGVRRPNGEYVMAPSRTVKIQLGDKLFAFGNAEAIQSIMQTDTPASS